MTDIEIPFWKMHGCGNDYIYVDLSVLAPDVRQWVESNASGLSLEMSERHYAIGADGLVLLGAPEGNADVRMIMYNADGSRGATCGNALRCVAKHLDAERCSIETDSGIVAATLRGTGDEGVAEVEMGRPIFDASRIPFLPDRADVLAVGSDTPWRIRFESEGADEAHVLSMGNPHCVVFVDQDPSDIDVLNTGMNLQTADFFPDSCNVEVARVTADLILQRTFERGTGETLACGSGACAVAVAAVAAGFRGRDEPIEIRLPGGALVIAYRSDDQVVMSGPAHRSFAGTYRVAPDVRSGIGVYDPDGPMPADFR